MEQKKNEIYNINILLQEIFKEESGAIYPLNCHVTVMLLIYSLSILKQHFKAISFFRTSMEKSKPRIT